MGQLKHLPFISQLSQPLSQEITQVSALSLQVPHFLLSQSKQAPLLSKNFPSSQDKQIPVISQVLQSELHSISQF